MDEHEARLKRLRMRSWRRGMKEMDLILGPFSDNAMSDLSAENLDSYEILLEENDQDLYLWITARLGDRHPGPAALAPLLDRIAIHARDRLQPK